jgi:hypothetical protein
LSWLLSGVEVAVETSFFDEFGHFDSAQCPNFWFSEQILSSRRVFKPIPDHPV